ncbi:Vacuolar aminopeptidase I [[Candida] zeylanoides]
MAELALLKAMQDAMANLELKLKQDAPATPAVASAPAASSRLEKGAEFYDKVAQEYIEFTYENPTIYHVVATVSRELTKAGFKYVAERDSWASLGAGKYFTTRNGSSLVAFNVGQDWTPQRGVGVVAGHIDALTAVLKPNSTKQTVEGYELLGVAPYAGGLSELWWDRDLGIGGRILVRSAKTKTVEQKLVDSTPHPIAHIPTLAPHFGAPSQGPFDKETQAVPVVGFSESPEPEATESEKKSPLYGKHPLKLLRYIAGLAHVEVEDIVQWDLQLYDVQKGALGGLKREFVFAPRIDDRVCSFAAYKALIESADSLPRDGFSVVGLFDNEEIGSASRQGIKGQLVETVVERVVSSLSADTDDSTTSELVRLAYANSVILSSDVNHLLNPNFTANYLENHKPLPNKGITIALDPDVNFATDSVGLALVERLAAINNDPIQYFQKRNGTRSGGTIGPSISLQTGARTIDLGIPQLSMHSIRATVGKRDIGHGIKFFAGFFEKWRETYDTFDDL